jgi:hypothetical protein
MTTSLAAFANTGVSLPDLPRTEPVDDPRLLALQIPTSAAARTSSCANNGFIPG